MIHSDGHLVMMILYPHIQIYLHLQSVYKGSILGTSFIGGHHHSPPAWMGASWAGLTATCQDRFSSTILLGGPGMQGTNEEVSPDTSRCWLVRTIKSGSYGRSPGTREALGVSPGFCGVSPDRGKVVRS